MQEIQIKKSELLDKLKENREKHAVAFQEARINFRKAITKELKRRAKEIKDGGKVDLDFNDFPKPKHYLNDYDDAIAVYEMEVRQEITLDFNDFRRYVLDKWDWQRQFAGTNSTYLAS